MSDTFLPGSGFDTYEQQDRVLVGMQDTTAAKMAVRILQQQGFAVAGAVVRLAPEEEPAVAAAKKAAAALGIECVVLNAEALAAQDAADARLSALLTAADKLGIQYIATGHFAQVETGADGEDTVVIRSMCNLCLSYDHRIIDGAEGAKFLQKVKGYLQNPILLI